MAIVQRLFPAALGLAWGWTQQRCEEALGPAVTRRSEGSIDLEVRFADESHVIHLLFWSPTADPDPRGRSFWGELFGARTVRADPTPGLRRIETQFWLENPFRPEDLLPEGEASLPGDGTFWSKADEALERDDELMRSRFRELVGDCESVLGRGVPDDSADAEAAVPGLSRVLQ